MNGTLTHAPDVGLHSLVLRPLQYLWSRVHVRATICVEKLGLFHVSSESKVCQRKVYNYDHLNKHFACTASFTEGK